MSDALVQYLREARATEAGLEQTLKVHIAATPPGVHRGRLEEHLRETQSHSQRLARRLDELEQDGQDPLGELFSLVSGSVGFGLGVARGATRVMLSLVGLPLTIFRDGGGQDADRVLRNVRAEAASEALEVATYTAIERLAAAEGDEETASLAASIRADEERMLEYLLGAAGEMAVPSSGGAPRAADRGRRAESQSRPAATEPRRRPRGGLPRPSRRLQRPSRRLHRMSRALPRASRPGRNLPTANRPSPTARPTSQKNPSSSPSSPSPGLRTRRAPRWRSPSHGRAMTA